MGSPVYVHQDGTGQDGSGRAPKGKWQAPLSKMDDPVLQD
jgi:hypothetical protein